MEQTLILICTAAVVLVGFVAYPRLMFAAVGSLLRGVFSLAVDCIALLFAWI